MKNGLIIEPNGTKYYYLNDQWHRVDGPAIEYANGSKSWFQHGKCHREDGPALITDDLEEWHFNGLLHRDGGPACIYSQSEYWYQYGKRHRLDGPAAIVYNGIPKNGWYYKGKLITTVSQEDFEKKIKLKAFW